MEKDEILHIKLCARAYLKQARGAYESGDYASALCFLEAAKDEIQLLADLPKAEDGEQTPAVTMPHTAPGRARARK